MTDLAFAPFESHLDQHTALSMLQNTVAKAEDGELFFERRRSETLVFDDGRLKSANFDAEEGFGLRAVLGEVTGYAHSTEISEAALKRAQGTVALAAQSGGGTWADAPARTNRSLYRPIDPTSETTFASKVDLLCEIDAFLRGLDPRVVQVSAVVSGECQEVVILRPDGTIYSDTRPMTRVNLSVIVEHEGRRETGDRKSVV